MIDGQWWQELEPQWKIAFGEGFFQHTKDPSPEELNSLFESPVIRLAGPTAPYPNLSFTLTNLSGVNSLIKLQILICTHQAITEIGPIANLPLLKSLFLLENKINNLSGIENLVGLEQLYLQFNEIDSMMALKKLTQLKEVFIHDNRITSLEGITEDHEQNLEKFFCLPNNGLRQKDIIRFEREVGIICRRV